ncbi:hypothetical protein C7S16_5487 [Burkholderia thailandensis]|uniref:Uncharacterized protein n=1 Tax=Burkholderia thailandensis TaxID=57975 RepID=A0AAW9CZ36_BURTH|nr:hypothetical protein [Burkholderia thailandensis]
MQPCHATSAQTSGDGKCFNSETRARPLVIFHAQSAVFGGPVAISRAAAICIDSLFF